MTEHEAVSRIYQQKVDHIESEGATLSKRKIKIVVEFLNSQGFADLAKELDT